MTDRDVARSERILEKIGNRLGLTEAGKEWLIAVVDPFHDTPLNVCGYPDTYEAASVVQVVKCSQQISVPSGIEGNWDCHIHSFPFHLPSPMYLANINNPILGASSGFGGNVQINPTGTPLATNWGGISVCSVAAGATTFDSGATGTAIPSQPLFSQIKPYLNGEYRVIGLGWEVINTTSDLNIQGLVTAYRQPAPSVTNGSSVLFTSLTGTPPTNPVWGYGSAVFDKAPPQNSGTALLLDGSKQWKAKEGCYIVHTLNSEEILTSGNMTSYVNTLAPTDSAISSYNATVVGLSSLEVTSFSATSTYTLNAFVPAGCLPMQFNAAGAYFTGLSNSTTLQLNAVYFVERFPTQNEADLVVLAKHSCRYDPVALDLYGEIIRAMPVGVPQRMNGLGDWFADAVSTASDFISPVLSAIPGAGAIGAMVKTAGNVAKSLQSKKESVSTYSPNGNNTGVPAKLPVAMKAMPKTKKKQAAQKKK